MISEVILGLTLFSLVIWIGLLCFRGQFWRTDQQLEVKSTDLEVLPSVCAIIPARNEAEMLPTTLRSLLSQSYLGSLSVILVDDNSTDDTAKIAASVADQLNKTEQLNIISGEPLPAGWTGKLWAMEQGIQRAQRLNPDYFLLTDADIEHDSQNLHNLIVKAQTENLDLVSLMVLLRCESFWEKLLIPAFVFFFAKLYPFRWVNNRNNSTAAAAGGCILIRRQALNRIGGLKILRQALIDDCTLAQAVKSRISPQSPLRRVSKQQFPFFLDSKEQFPFLQEKYKEQRPFFRASQEQLSVFEKTKKQLPVLPTSNPQFSILPKSKHKNSYAGIWLGLTSSTRSLRPYPSLLTIWDMVARTAFTQLNYSFWLLLGTLISMTLIYLVSPFAVIWGTFMGNWLLAIAGLCGWLLMVVAYLPMIRFYKLSALWALSLPAIALLYTLMTVDSAWRYWQGKGGSWKGRVYSNG